MGSAGTLRVTQTKLGETAGRIPRDNDPGLKLMKPLLHSLKLTTENLQSQQGKPKLWFGKKARDRLFSPGEKVLS